MLRPSRRADIVKPGAFRPNRPGVEGGTSMSIHCSRARRWSPSEPWPSNGPSLGVMKRSARASARFQKRLTQLAVKRLHVA
eukprot:7381726-Prymnesium_polylepis.1